MLSMPISTCLRTTAATDAEIRRASSSAS